MNNLIAATLLTFCTALAGAAETDGIVDRSLNGDATISAPAAIPDSLELEHDLQGLSWKEIRAVIESVPKMKAEVDSYGVLGWSYVEANYRRYAWRHNLDRMDDEQKLLLAEKIRLAREGRQRDTAVNGSHDL